MEPSFTQTDSGFLSVTTGETLTLHCFNYGDDSTARHFWFNKPLGQRPQKISSLYVFESKTTFYGDFKDNPRFSLDVENRQNHLTITDIQISDSGTYYCFTFNLFNVNFTRIVTVSVMGLKEKAKSFILQSESDSVQTGSSVTLTCTVYTGSCNGEHKLHWFRSSKDSQPGYIYLFFLCYVLKNKGTPIQNVTFIFV
uniref:Ig-like domain-containing protein n=1 Tax=Gouania willdenowi TaxID=441366 RepID=A0A8C5HJL6_GOUWI